MKLREGRLSDLKRISQIYARSWKAAYKGMISAAYLEQLQEDYWVEPFKKRLEEGTSLKVVCSDKGEIIGAASYMASDYLEDAGEIISIYIEPENYHQGYGSVLMQAVLEDIKAQGWHYGHLWVIKENRRARSFYEKMGFKCSGQEMSCEIGGRLVYEIGYTIEI